MLKKGLNQHILVIVILLLTISVFAQSDTAPRLSTDRIGARHVFKLDGKLWFPKGHFYDPGMIIHGNSRLESVQKIKFLGYNFLQVVLTTDIIKRPETQELFEAARKVGLPVLIYHNLIWEMWDWAKVHPEQNMRGFWEDISLIEKRFSEGHGEWPTIVNHLDPVVQEKIKKSIKEVIAFGESQGCVIAYQLCDSDFFKIIEDSTPYWQQFSADKNLSMWAYNEGIRDDYVEWLKDRNFSLKEIGAQKWDEIYLPTSNLNSLNDTHWISWKEYKRVRYIFGAVKMYVNYARTLTNKPIGVGCDAGFCFDYQDQLAAPHLELDKVCDFVGFFMGWNGPHWWDKRRGNMLSNFVNVPIIGLFDVVSLNAEGRSGVTTRPGANLLMNSLYTAGYVVTVRAGIGKPGGISRADYEEFTKYLNMVDDSGIWEYTPVQPKAAVFQSLPDAMFTGIHNWGVDYDIKFLWAVEAQTGILARGGIPYDVIYRAEKLKNYDFVMSELTGARLFFSPHYDSLPQTELEEFVKSSGVFMKGPYPMRNSVKEVAYINVGSERDNAQNMLAHLGSGWGERKDDKSERAFEEHGVSYRNITTAGSGIIVPVSGDTRYYELSFWYYEDTHYPVKVEVLGKDGWCLADVVECKKRNYWNETVLTIPAKLFDRTGMFNSKGKIRIRSEGKYPISYIRWSPLSNFIAQDKQVLYSYKIAAPESVVDLPGVNKGTKADKEPIYGSDMEAQYLKNSFLDIEKDDIVLAVSESLNRDKLPVCAARPLGKGMMMKLSSSLCMKWYNDHQWDGERPELYNQPYNKALERFVRGLILCKRPGIVAYQVKDAVTGQNITDEIECTIAKLENEWKYALVIFNHSEKERKFTIALSCDFLELPGSVAIQRSDGKVNDGKILITEQLDFNSGRIVAFEVANK